MCGWEVRSNTAIEGSLRQGGRWKIADPGRSFIPPSHIEATLAAHSRLRHQVRICCHVKYSYLAYTLRLVGLWCNRRFEGPISRMRNARQSAAAPPSARAFKHQIHTTLDGEHVKSGNLRGAGVSLSVKGPIWRMRNTGQSEAESHPASASSSPPSASIIAPWASGTKWPSCEDVRRSEDED